MHCHPPTRAYVERRTKQGLSKLDILRCLKRYIAREVYQHLTSPSAPLAQIGGISHSTCRYLTRQERTGWTVNLTRAARTAPASTRWTVDRCLVIRRLQVRVLPGDQIRRSQA
jgi:hypothetical protein